MSTTNPQTTTEDEPRQGENQEIVGELHLNSGIRAVIRQYIDEDNTLQQKIKTHGFDDPIGVTASELQQLVAVVRPFNFTYAAFQTNRQRIINTARETGVIPS